MPVGARSACRRRCVRRWEGREPSRSSSAQPFPFTVLLPPTAYFSLCAGICRECAQPPLAGRVSPAFSLFLAAAPVASKTELAAWARDAAALSDALALHAYAAGCLAALPPLAVVAPAAFPALAVMRRCGGSAAVAAVAARDAALRASFPGQLQLSGAPSATGSERRK